VRRKLLIAAIATLVLVPLCGVLYLKFADLGRHRGWLEEIVSEALGRKLTISGVFDADLSVTSRLVAEQVSLANPDWSDDPHMLEVDRIEISVNLWSLVSRPVRVHELHIRGAKVRLERDGKRRANWQFDLRNDDDKKKERSGKSWIMLEQVRVESLDLFYRDPERDLRLNVDRFDADPGSDEMVEVNLAGEFDGAAVELSGRLTHLHRLLAGAPLRHELTGRLGRVKLVSRGKIVDVVSLREPELEFRVDGPEIAEVTSRLALPSLGSGPFHLDARVGPSARGVDLALSADLVELKVEAHGGADSLIAPRELDMEVKLSGVDLEASAGLLGRSGLPAEPFELSGSLSSDGKRAIFEQVRGRVGEHSVSINGAIRISSEIFDTDLEYSRPRARIFPRSPGWPPWICHSRATGSPRIWCVPGTAFGSRISWAGSARSIYVSRGRWTRRFVLPVPMSGFMHPDPILPLSTDWPVSIYRSARSSFTVVAKPARLQSCSTESSSGSARTPRVWTAPSRPRIVHGARI